MCTFWILFSWQAHYPDMESGYESYDVSTRRRYIALSWCRTTTMPYSMLRMRWRRGSSRFATWECIHVVLLTTVIPPPRLSSVQTPYSHIKHNCTERFCRRRPSPRTSRHIKIMVGLLKFSKWAVVSVLACRSFMKHWWNTWTCIHERHHHNDHNVQLDRIHIIRAGWWLPSLALTSAKWRSSNIRSSCIIILIINHLKSWRTTWTRTWMHFRAHDLIWSLACKASRNVIPTLAFASYKYVVYHDLITYIRYRDNASNPINLRSAS